MKITAVVPIKLNNERLPGKNLKMLGDKPLIHYILHTITSIPQIEAVYVYCSNEEVCGFLPEGVQFLKRPQFLDSQSTHFNQIFDCFISEVKSDIYVLAHVTAPFLRPETVIECIEQVKAGNHDAAFTVTKMQEFLWTEGRPFNFDPCDLPRTQDLSPIYKETTGLYVFTKQSYVENHSRTGRYPYMKEVSFKEAIDIDNPEDFKLAEYVLNM
jgi:CMP-N-acetylneuraminic acid synthetase